MNGNFVGIPQAKPFTLVIQKASQPTAESNPYQGFFRYHSLIKFKFKFNL